ncbi:DNA gyrase subunit A [Morus notabilis]|uniref:DNA topoisomerase (ATP-hydrolyzing) n=1 Tax=Morus notabilis TaxID=981085 RepID=W9SBT9_9ROSA|nr:DNA gyrase subunit A [Morus notabilis]
MAFSSGLRFSSLLRCRLSSPLSSAQSFRLRQNLPEFRFLSAAPRSRSRIPRPVKARRRDELANGGGGEGENGNGSVLVKDGGGSDGRVVAAELHKEATEAYMAYAMSVLLGRALPDVRDGLKPVHRRILYAMHELGLSSKKPFKKCARVVGEVLGKFHPHGDSAVYDSLVRMAQALLVKAHKEAENLAGQIHKLQILLFFFTSPRISFPSRWSKLQSSETTIIFNRALAILLEPKPTDAILLTQDFSLRFPLIQGHGNFGSIDADPPAAMRYTECRLDPLAEATLLADLELDTVDFAPNFDNSQKEPSLLPARLPTLLLNGSSGIAVGMATNIPPHNLGELVDVLCVLIRNPEATLQELLEYMPGPDFPTGGLIMGNIGILEAYRTGRGRIVVRGKTDVELLDSKTKRTAIIINEIPYQTNKSALVEKIAELVENKGPAVAQVLNLNPLSGFWEISGSIDGISDIRDESDRSGMRIVIELKRGSDHSIVLNNLFRLTSLQSSFSCNMVGILNGQPKQMGLKELLEVYKTPNPILFLISRCSVVERRARFKLFQAQERRHIVEGIVVGLDNLDGVIRIIRKSSSNAVASTGLQNEFNLSEKQAEAILDINLRRLTLLERKKFVDESESLRGQISKLEELLASKKHILEVVEKEAIELKNKFSNPRRSLLDDTDGGQLEDIDVIPNEEMLLAFSEKGYVKRMKPNTFNLQTRGTIGKSVGKLRVNDAMSDFIVCRAHDHVLYFSTYEFWVSCYAMIASDKGTVYSARAYKIPECTRTAAGTPLVQILSLSDGERITSVIPVSEFSGDQFLLMLTANGYIKKVPGDELKWVRCCSNDDVVAMASQNGMVILTSCDKIRTQGRNTRGAVAMRLKAGDKMASVDIIPGAMRKDFDRVSGPPSKGVNGPWLLFISESGYGKRVPLSSFRSKPLNRVGLIGYKFAAEDRLAAVFVVGFSLAGDGESDEQVVLVSQSGTVNRIKVRDVSIQSRYARGVILMRLDYAGKIQSASLISATDSQAEEEVSSAVSG